MSAVSLSLLMLRFLIELFNMDNDNISPMLKQFLDLKKKHPDALLLFRCGDFYETYMQDAVTASGILGITLTRSCKQKDPDGKSLEMAGFPFYYLDTYLPKLIRAGNRVAICDKIEAPKKTEHRSKKRSAGKEKLSEIDKWFLSCFNCV